jgi:hypothetical protein
MADELTQESTPEEIQSFVDDIAAERAGDNAPPKPESKSDAEIVNGLANNEVKEKTPAATAGDETAEETAKAPEGKGETDDRSWLDDDLKAEVAAYGIGEDVLADFTSREEVERALRIFDKTALEAGRKKLAEGESKGTTRDDKGRFVKSETEIAKAEPEKKPGAKADGYEVKLDKSVYDDGIVEEFTRMRDHYESRLEGLESIVHTANARAEEQHFDSLVDSLGHTDLFGKSDHENAKQLERRRDLHVQVKAMINGMASLGRPTEMSEALINRVARMVFAEELGKKDLKSRTVKISKQSNGRQGGGATRPNEPREDPRDAADRLYKELLGA